MALACRGRLRERAKNYALGRNHCILPTVCDTFIDREDMEIVTEVGAGTALRETFEAVRHSRKRRCTEQCELVWWLDPATRLRR